MQKILLIGDTHLPYISWDAVGFAADFAKSYKPDLIIQMGDLIDAYSWSLFKRSPNSPSAAAEWDETEHAVHAFRSKFSKSVPWKILEGNHCRRYMLRAFEQNIPRKLIKSLDELFPFENWSWHMESNPLVIHNTMFIHGDEMGGNVIQKAQRLGMNVVQGHDHQGMLHYIITFQKQIWAMSTGTLMDGSSIAGAYAAKNPMKCWMGVCTITNGVPQMHPFRG